MTKRKSRDPVWDAMILEAQKAIGSLPRDVRDVLIRVTADIADIGEDEHVPPLQMGMAMAALISGLCLDHVRGNVHDDAGIDEFIARCHAALHVGVAKVRLAGGLRL